MSYETFAFIYDEVMDERLYEKWLTFSKQHLSADKNSILELACGTGTLAVELAQEGFDMTALDLSEEMLTMASNRAIKKDTHVQFVQGNMLDLSEFGQYDAITCFSDSLCYMQNQQEIQQVFDEVYQSLYEKGVFLFDVHSIYQIETIFPEYSYHYQTEDFAFLWDSYEGEKKYSIEHCLTFFVKDKKNQDQFVRYDEFHKERTYTMENYLRMLENSGFSEVKIYADFTDKAPDDESRRWFFVCQK